MNGMFDDRSCIGVSPLLAFDYSLLSLFSWRKNDLALRYQWCPGRIPAGLFDLRST